MVRVATAAAARAVSPSSSTAKFAIRLGGLCGVLLAITGGFITEPWAFWLLVVSGYGALLAGVVEATPWKGPLVRTVAVLVLLLVVLTFSLEVVFVAAPLELNAFRARGAYPSDSMIGGISWRPEYAALTLNIRNETDRDYEEVDIGFIVRGASVVDVGLLDTGLSASLVRPGTDMELQVNTEEDSGLIVTRPMNPGFTKNGEYRVRFSSLPRNSGTLRIVVATADTTPLEDNMARLTREFGQTQIPPGPARSVEIPVRPGGELERLFGPPPRPTHIDVVGRYRVARRTRALEQAVQIVMQ